MSFLYTDGACSGNPGPGGWSYLLVETVQAKVIENGARAEMSTNNEMELKAAIFGVEKYIELGSQEELKIYADSKFVINGITQWVRGWEKRGWKKADGAEPSHLMLWKKLDELTKRAKFPISWNHIDAHSGYLGNERVDQIAVAFSLNKNVDLYNGSLSHYPYAKDVINPTKKHSSQDYPIYLSLVNGKLEKHKTWSACEAAVRGQSRPLYKKVLHTLEEEEILKKWGIKK